MNNTTINRTTKTTQTTQTTQVNRTIIQTNIMTQNINPIIEAISCPESDIYLNLDLQPLWVCNLRPDIHETHEIHETYKTHETHETPKYNYSFPTSPALNPNSPLTPTSTYYKLTPLFFFWIKQQLQLTQILYKQNKISFAVYSEWRSKFHAIKDYAAKKFNNEIAKSIYDGEILAGYLHHNYSELLSAQIIFTESQINSYSQILPLPIEINVKNNDCSNNSNNSDNSNNMNENPNINSLTIPDKQLYEYSNQIAPAIFNQWLNLTQAHYPFFCIQVAETEPPLTHIYTSLLWLNIAWQAFIQKANIVLSVILEVNSQQSYQNNNQQQDQDNQQPYQTINQTHDHRLRKFVIFSLANIFNKTFKDLYKKEMEAKKMFNDYQVQAAEIQAA